jgi:ElaB/YqjD/DUF883 family membrane-anchored ribosome-binding protein
MSSVDFTKRREALKEEIGQIQKRIGMTMEDIRNEATEQVQSLGRPETWVRRYPLASIGLAMVGGFIIGRMATKKVKSLQRALPSPQAEAQVQSAPLKRKNSYMQFLKSFASQLWQQYGPMVIAAGQDFVARKAAAYVERRAQASMDEKPSKKL